MTHSDAQHQDAAVAEDQPAEDGGPLQIQDQRLAPVRGLIPLHNAKNQPFPVLDLRRWIRLSRAVYISEKIDLFACGPVPSVIKDLLRFTDDAEIGLNVKLSLRTDCSALPDGLEALRDGGLFDVFLCPASFEGDYVKPWLSECRRLELPIRLELRAPFGDNADPQAFAKRIGQAGVHMVNLTVDPPFDKPVRAGGREALDGLIALAAALDAQDVETNLVGVPFCLTPETLWPHVATRQQFHLDHQQYNNRAYELAKQLYRLSPTIVGKVILLNVGRYTSRETRIDIYLLGWLVHEHPVAYAAVSLLRKIASLRPLRRRQSRGWLPRDRLRREPRRGAPDAWRRRRPPCPCASRPRILSVSDRLDDCDRGRACCPVE